MSTSVAMFMIAEATGSILDESQIQEAKDFYEDPKNLHKPLRMKMRFMDVDTKNANGRIYRYKPVAESHNEIQRLIKLNHLHGEYQHPLVDSTNPARFMSVPGDTTAINIRECKLDGKTVRGEIETLMSSKGKEYKDMILYNNVTPAVSLRAVGSVTHRGNEKIIENKLKVITYDAVTNPSFHNAIAEKIITESEVANMIEELSEGYQMVMESFDRKDIDIKPANSEVKYNIEENTVLVCTDGSCLKVFLEEHIKSAFKYSFANSLYS